MREMLCFNSHSDTTFKAFTQWMHFFVGIISSKNLAAYLFEYFLTHLNITLFFRLR